MDNLGDLKRGFLPGIIRRKTNTEKGKKTILGYLPDSMRNHFIAMSGEFVGTFLFLFIAFAGTQTANMTAAAQTPGPNSSNVMYISLVFGFSLAVNAWVFFRVSGGLFNPAVTLGMCLIGAVPPIRSALVAFSQVIAGMCAAGVVSATFPGKLAVATTLTPGTSIARGLFIEMFLTAQLVITIFMLAAEKHKGTYLAPIGIGLSLFIAELAGVYYTGGSLNPARSFGPAVALRSFPGYHWIYWVGPALGALLAAGFFAFIKSLEYETANPGQDLDDLEAQAYNPEKDNTRPNLASGEFKISSNRTVSRDGSTQLNGFELDERQNSSGGPASRANAQSQTDAPGGTQTAPEGNHTR